jgi:anti-sigma regulatory factor (Ser/Thr protein kinase)
MGIAVKLIVSDKGFDAEDPEKVAKPLDIVGVHVGYYAVSIARGD